jgi:DNA-binding NtrC family response regulator
MRKKNVVVVDDDESIRKTFNLILHEKYQVYLAKDPKEALMRYKDLDINLIITDLRLPNISGLKMVEEFRKFGYKGEVILVSAFPDLVELTDLERLSIGHFFIKPLDLEALNQSIHYVLDEKKNKDRGLKTNLKIS